MCRGVARKGIPKCCAPCAAALAIAPLACAVSPPLPLVLIPLPRASPPLLQQRPLPRPVCQKLVLLFSEKYRQFHRCALHQNAHITRVSGRGSRRTMLNLRGAGCKESTPFCEPPALPAFPSPSRHRRLFAALPALPPRYSALLQRGPASPPAPACAPDLPTSARPVPAVREAATVVEKGKQARARETAAANLSRWAASCSRSSAEVLVGHHVEV